MSGPPPAANPQHAGTDPGSPVLDTTEPAEMDDRAECEEDTDVNRGVNVGDAASGKSRLLSRQCSTCIFRPGNLMHLSHGRLHDIVTEARAKGCFIVCHDTLPGMHEGAAPAICRGFRERYSTQALQIIERLWGFLEIEPPAALNEALPPA